MAHPVCFTATLHILHVLWFTFYSINSRILSCTVNQEKKQGVKKCHVQSQGVGMAVAAKQWQGWLCVPFTE